MRNFILILTALLGLSLAEGVRAEERYVVFAKSDFATSGNKNWHGGECYCLVLETIRGKPIQVDAKGVTGISVNDKGVWHDFVTGADIYCSPEFEFTVTRAGQLLALAGIAKDGKFVIHGRVFLPLQDEELPAE